MVWRAALAVLLLSLGCPAGADPLEVPDDHTAGHEIGSFTHIVRELESGGWHHRSGLGFHCFQEGPPEPGASPDSIYFYPRLPRWAALVTTGPPFSWASCAGLELPGYWVHGWETPGYVALRRGGYQRYAVAFVYLGPDDDWLGWWEWQIRQEGEYE